MISSSIQKKENNWMREEIVRKTLVLERRHAPRFSTRDYALVAETGDDSGQPYHLVDISESGMAFRQIDESPLALTDSTMDIFLADGPYVCRLPVTVVADRQLAYNGMSKQRCCVRFGKLTPGQQNMLRAFILCYTKNVQTGETVTDC
ncbi:MAG: hypothetical protein A2511_05900 [Deltaproteobacteria bacterium RIFOXYD12_FULL_50_9]|nr:MAG: hypothetical protein A2511_05900 [Deltaproteobacteria bacterium RIFOXYD12_FULL_50_9]